MIAVCDHLCGPKLILLVFDISSASALLPCSLEEPTGRRTMNIRGVRRRVLVIAFAASTLMCAACSTLTGAAVGAGGGAAVGAATGYGAGKGALVGTGIGAAAGAIYDITR
jgi:hypothetical protein